MPIPFPLIPPPNNNDAAVVQDDGSMAFATNAAFDAWFHGVEHFFDNMLRHKTIGILLLARCVRMCVYDDAKNGGVWPYTLVDLACNPNARTSLIDPDDRQAFLETVVRMFFSAAPVRESLIVKVSDVGCTALQIWGEGAPVRFFPVSEPHNIPPTPPFAGL